MEAYEYSKSTLAYHRTYVRSSRAIGVLWAIFSICFSIINILIFAYPNWIGNSPDSNQPGQFGLFQYSTLDHNELAVGETTKGRLDNFDLILTSSFKACTILVGISCILSFIVIASFILFICVDPKRIYLVSGSLQLTSFILLLAAVIVYPSGWDNTVIQSVCGSEVHKYQLGSCELRWAYILAIVGVFDVMFLTMLAYILATKQADSLPETPQNSTKGDGTIPYGPDVNSSMSGLNVYGGQQGHLVRAPIPKARKSLDQASFEGKVQL